MTIDKLVSDTATNKERMLAYARAQHEDMKVVYSLMYARDGDNGTGLTFKEFLPHYVAHGHAKTFHDNNYHKYFNEETK